jgi:hypothetical protein
VLARALDALVGALALDAASGHPAAEGTVDLLIPGVAPEVARSGPFSLGVPFVILHNYETVKQGCGKKMP